MKNIFLLLFVASAFLASGRDLPSPRDHFGFVIGANYKLANYTQTEAYFRKLAALSDRVRLVEMGKTEEGRTQLMAIVTSPGNLKNLDHFKGIAQKLARAESLTDQDADALAAEGKAVVWIDGGLHATETVGTHQLIEMLWQLASRNDRETMKILDEVIVLLAHANPDGQELVSNWYMNNPDSLKRSFNQLPRLYQKYAGHDNNRDFYMMNMQESRNISRQLYLEWMPQIIYNHHQAGPPGSVVAGPPYRDPFNYLFHPLVITGIDALGAAMTNRLEAEEKPGYTERGGSVFSTWYNGGLRTTSYFHNMIGILTEIIGNPTPSNVPLVPSRLLPNGNTPYPVMPQKWNFRRSIDYSVSLNYAILDYAARNREHLMKNIYLMGKSAIDAGSRDHWTILPKRLDAISQAATLSRPARRNEESATASRERPDTLAGKYLNIVLKDSTLRDPRGYILPSDQPDFPTATRFVNALILSGIRVHRATAAFAVAGKKYPSGSFVVWTDQAFRPHVLDMFEPQDHPNDFLYPGGPPVKPYDIAGWTPAFSMGIRFDRIMNGFSGPFQVIPYGETVSPGLPFPAGGSAAGYLLDARCVNSFAAVNELLAKGMRVCRITGEQKPGLATGSFWIGSDSKTTRVLQKINAEKGLSIKGESNKPKTLSGKLTQKRIAVWDTYGGSISAGWLRWILEQHGFAYSNLYVPEINAGNLRSKFDVIIFVSGAIPSVSGDQSFFRDTTRIKDIPAEYQKQWGRISADTSIVQLKKFLEAGGNIITIGRSTNLAYHLKLPVRNALEEMIRGKATALSAEKFYIPGSLLRVRVDTVRMAGWGMEATADVFFDSSPVFRIAPEAVASGKVRPIAWFGQENPLRSGWAFGAEYLQDGVAAFDAVVGQGRLVAFGPEITFRAQTANTFKLLFNQLYSGY